MLDKRRVLLAELADGAQGSPSICDKLEYVQDENAVASNEH